MELAKYIRLQRTNLIGLDDLETIDFYNTIIRNEFKIIEPFLPEICNSILDIGAGVGGLTKLVRNKYPNAKLYILDGDGENNHWGFRNDCEASNSKEITESVVGGVDKWFDINTTEKLETDLVISTRAYGYHFPLSKYNVKYKTLIVDIRNGHEPDCKYDVIFRGDDYTRIRINA
jgi:hypothetical protein